MANRRCAPASNMYMVYANSSSGCGRLPEREIVYLSYQNALKVWVEMKVRAGEISKQVAKDIETAWDGRTETFELAVKNLLPAAVGATTPARVLADLKRGGRISARIVPRNGTQYLVFKGNPTLRRLIKGTRYRLDNAQIAKLGFGKAGIKSAARGGFVVSFVVCGGYNGLQWALDDSYTWKHFVADMAVDIGIATISAAAGAAVALFVAAAGGVTVMAVGPVLIAIAVATGISVLLSLAATEMELDTKIRRAIISGEKALQGIWDGTPMQLDDRYTNEKRDFASRHQDWYDRMVSSIIGQRPMRYRR